MINGTCRSPSCSSDALSRTSDSFKPRAATAPATARDGMYSTPARMKGTYRRITPSSSRTEKLCATPAAAASSGGIGGWKSGRRLDRRIKGEVAVRARPAVRPAQTALRAWLGRRVADEDHASEIASRCRELLVGSLSGPLFVAERERLPILFGEQDVVEHDFRPGPRQIVRAGARAPCAATAIARRTARGRGCSARRCRRGRCRCGLSRDRRWRACASRTTSVRRSARKAGSRGRAQGAPRPGRCRCRRGVCASHGRE